MIKTAAVTGATGFVGSHLIRYLADRGVEVRALTRRPQPEHPGITWIKGTFADKAALEKLVMGAEVLYHIAGAVKARNFKGFTTVNRDSVQALLAALQRQNARPHFILLSSLAARERHLSAYAESKRQGEEMLIREAPDDLPWTIFRPPAIYGPGDMEILKLFKSLKWRLALVPGNPANRVAVIYVEDLITALADAALRDSAYGRILDIDDGTPGGYALGDVFATAARLIGRPAFSLTVGHAPLKTFAHANIILSKLFRYIPMVSPGKVNELCHPDWICRDEHAKDVLPWQPQVSLHEGLEKSFRWYRQNNLL
ncbi:NAD-dependent epimerase/dehydratase family protein [Luteithermobacter gelatinilyticus]|uniref:NAD-dependent epimerase/dehydratase family protein n=1 Tax=Luteithermobacter gelatinilyticus TaxID=2582913 RepID=UPI001106F140|nr:NAD(P)-dependent oxidoreductase [Luteithermobacter gelatinilyticus]